MGMNSASKNHEKRFNGFRCKKLHVVQERHVQKHCHMWDFCLRLEIIEFCVWGAVLACFYRQNLCDSCGVRCARWPEGIVPHDRHRWQWNYRAPWIHKAFEPLGARQQDCSPIYQVTLVDFGRWRVNWVESSGHDTESVIFQVQHDALRPSTRRTSEGNGNLLSLPSIQNWALERR